MQIETVYLVTAAVALILLLILSFFIFQIWVTTKEIKIQIVTLINELQRGFNNAGSDIRLFKEQLDGRMKELDKNLSEKLVGDLENIFDKYGQKITEKNDSFLKEFAKATEEIKLEQKKLLRAITEPLKPYGE